MIPLKIEGYSFEIVRKNIKHIYFRIYHSKKKIIVSAPLKIKAETLHTAILSKKCWLERQVYDQSQVIPLKNSFFPHGDTLMLDGHECPVQSHLASGHSRIRIGDDGIIHFYAKPGSTISHLEQRIDRWYRNELKLRIKKLVEYWEPTINVNINEFRVKKMKTRWGTCNIDARRIWLNFSLIKLEKKFLEYVVVHEMVHLLERSHNDRFKQFMDRFIPEWRSLKKQLNLFKL